MQLEREARGRPVRTCLPSEDEWPLRREHPNVIELMAQLLEWEPSKRPAAAIVVKRCKELREKVNDPANLMGNY
jgi:hypothetical protein